MPKIHQRQPEELDEIARKSEALLRADPSLSLSDICRRFGLSASCLSHAMRSRGCPSIREIKEQ
jgi:hypothetical protein